MATPRCVRWTALDLAGSGARAASVIIDAGMAATVWACGMIWLVEAGELGTPVRLFTPRAWLWLVVVCAVWLLVDAAATHLFGGTIGAALAGIEVRTTPGTLPGMATAAWRALLKVPALMVLPFERAAAGGRRWRPLHDRLTGTVVVRSSAVEAVSPGHVGGCIGTATAEAVDANEAAIRRAGLNARRMGWLRAVADQTVVRLDIANPSWRRADDADAIRQRAFCLLLARLMARYPEQRDTLAAVVAAHDGLRDVAGDRARFLMGLLDDPVAARRWIGLVDSADVRIVLDDVVSS